MALPVPTDTAEQRSRAIAEREVAVKQSRERRAKLYGQTFDLIHGLRQFGCTLQDVDPSFPVQDSSIASRAKFIESCIADPSLTHNILTDKLAIADPSEPGLSSADLTFPLPEPSPTPASDSAEAALGGRARLVRDREMSNAEVNSSARASVEPPEVAAFSQNQVENSQNRYRFESPAPELSEGSSQKPFSQRTIDRHSPSFNPQSLPLTATGYTLPAVTVDPSQLLLHQPEASASASAENKSLAPGKSGQQRSDEPKASPTYVNTMPELPASLAQNRVAVGGMLRQKREREKERSGQINQSNVLSGGLELVKTGQLHASLLSVRHLLGTPPATDPTVDPKLRGVRPAKVILTDEWRVAYKELEVQRAMERIETLKAQNKWSFKQPKKQRGPHLHKGHWDYLLDEMRWMQTDFKQERRWKQAVAFEISTNVLEYWAASPDERKQMRVKVRLPLEREAAADTDMGAGEDEHEDADGDAEADAETDEEANEATQVKSELLDEEPAHAKKLQDPVPEPSKSQSKLLEYRAPVFEQPDSRTLVSLDTFSSEDPSFVDFKDMPEPQTMSELMPDLSMYGPPAPPASEEERLQSRRIDPSSPHYSRLTTVSNLMTDKPILLSTLNPAQKRKWGTDQWEDLSDLYLSDEPAEPRPSETNTAVSRLFSTQDGSVTKPPHPSLRKEPEAPRNPEQRLRLNDWSEADDKELKALADKYMPNWGLIADIFNGNTFRVKVDRRDAWDMWHRYHAKFGPQAQPEPNLPPGLRKVARKEHHQKAMQETIRKQQKRRDMLPPKPAPNAPRRVNLNAHETHTLPVPRTFVPMELSRLKGEKDAQAAQTQQLLMRHQAMLRQQQLQAQVQMQVHQQRMLQAQQQAMQGRPPSGQSQQANGSAGSPPEVNGAHSQSPPTRSAPTPMPS